MKNRIIDMATANTMVRISKSKKEHIIAIVKAATGITPVFEDFVNAAVDEKLQHYERMAEKNTVAGQPNELRKAQ